MESIERLLANIKAEYEGNQQSPDLKAQPTRLQQTATPSDREKLVPDNLSSLPENPLIAELRAEYEEKPTQLSPQTPPQPANLRSENFSALPENRLIAELKAECEEQSRQPQLLGAIPPIPLLSDNFSTELDNSLIADLKAEYEEVQKAEELKKQQAIEEERRKQQQLLQQKRLALTKQAEKWLKKLDPLSEEGLWFEELAYKYPSKLEAAIDYLQALEQTTRKND